MNLGTLQLCDFMTLFYLKLAALWLILGIETLNEINICFQTHRSALEITRAVPHVPNQCWELQATMESDDHIELIYSLSGTE